MSDELTKEDYYDKETIKHRADDILQKWKALLELLQRRRLVLDKLGSLVDMIRDADSLYADLKHLEVYSSSHFSNIRLPLELEYVYHRHS